MSKIVEDDDATKVLRAQTLDPDTPGLYSKVMWRNWFPVMVSVLTLIACGYDQSMSWDLPLLQSFLDEITSANPYALATFNSLTEFAGMMAAVFMPFAYDYKGRRFGFFIGNVVVLIGSLVSVFGSLDIKSQHAVPAFYAGRFFAVLGIDVAAGCSWMYASEVSHPAHRAFFGGLYGICWSVGYLFNTAMIFGMTFLPYSSWQWRIPTIFQCFFSIIIIACIPYIPESPRTLISKGRRAEAEEVVRKWVGCNVASEKFVADQMAELDEAFANAAPTETLLQVYNMKPLWATANARRRVFIFIFTNAIITLINVGATGGVFQTLIYGMVGLNQDRVKTAVNFANSLLGIIVGYIACMYLDSWGRRRTYLICYSIAFVFGFVGVIAMEGFASTQQFGYAALYIVAIYVGTIYSAPMGPVKLLFESELLAYDYRAKGKALNDLTGKPSNIVASYIQAAVLSAIGYRSFWAAQAYTFIFLVVHWFIMPETKNRTLEEVDEIFDHPSPFETNWFKRNSTETNYVTHSLNILRSRANASAVDDIETSAKA